MDDLSEKLDRLLSSPDSLKRIEEMMAAFGGAPPVPEAPTSPPPIDPLGGDLLLKALPLLTAFQQEDDNAALLHALRPHLGQARQKRLDDAEKLMRLVRLLPLLKEVTDTGEESQT